MTILITMINTVVFLFVTIDTAICRSKTQGVSL